MPKTYEDGLAEGRREAETAALTKGMDAVVAEIGKIHGRLDEVLAVRCEPRGARIAVLEAATRRIWWMVGGIGVALATVVGLLVKLGFSMGAL